MQYWSLFAIALLLALPAWQAADGQLSIGSDHGAYEGLDEAVAWIETQDDGSYDNDAVLYHDALGWHLRFYLYESSRSGALELRWFPSSTYLADNIEKAPHLRKFYVAPDWAHHADLSQRLAMRGIALATRATYGHFAVYEMSSDRTSTCDWRLCLDHAQAAGWQQYLPAGPMSYADLAKSYPKTTTTP